MTAQHNTMSAYAEIVNSTKIVAQDELTQIMLDLQEKRLSPQQQDATLLRAVAVAPIWTKIFNEIADPQSGTRALFTEKNPDRTVGMYEDRTTGKNYVSASFLVAAAAIETLRMSDLTNDPAVGLHAAICVEAFKLCEDQTAKIRGTPSIRPAY